MRRAFWGLSVFLLAMIAVTGSAIIHLGQDVGRDAARDGFTGLISNRVRGTAHVESMDDLDFDHVLLSNFSVTAPNGETVVEARQFGGEINWASIIAGDIELAPAFMADGTMRVTRGPDDQINLVHAMEVPEDRWMVPIGIHDIRLENLVMEVNLPGKPPLTMRDVNGLADMDLGHTFMCRVDDTSGFADLPIVNVGFRHLNGRIQSDNRNPMRVELLLDLEVAQPGARMTYRVPGLVGDEGDAHFDLDLDVDIGVSDAEDDCDEGDTEECPPGRRVAKPDDEDDQDEARAEAQRAEERSELEGQQEEARERARAARAGHRDDDDDQ